MQFSENKSCSNSGTLKQRIELCLSMFKKKKTWKGGKFLPSANNRTKIKTIIAQFSCVIYSSNEQRGRASFSTPSQDRLSNTARERVEKHTYKQRNI